VALRSSYCCCVREIRLTRPAKTLEYNKPLAGREAHPRSESLKSGKRLTTLVQFEGSGFQEYPFKEIAMDCTRRRFASRMGTALAGALTEDAWAHAAVRAGASSARGTQNEEHSKAPMTTHASGSDESKRSTAEEVWAKLLEGNQRFVDGKLLARDVVARRRAVLAGQQPQAVVLSCSDSRTSPSTVFDQGLGDLFEVRTAGNVADALAMGSIEYALLNLPVRVVVILGHEKCAAVAAAASGQKMATANLQSIVEKIAPAIAKVQGDHKSQEFLLKAVEANVLHCATDLLTNSSIVRRETAANNIEIIKAVYSLKTGQVRRLVG